MFFIIIKMYIIILTIFSIRAVVPRAKIIDLIEFFWKNILMFILLYLFLFVILIIIYIL